MKKITTEHRACLILIIIVLCVSFFFGAMKSGYSIDEIYSYGLSNSYRAPFIEQVCDGEISGTLLTREMMMDYISVDRKDDFSFGSVYYNQTQDVHPPLHYWVLHLFSSLVPGVFSKWIGLAMNIILFAAAMIMLYRLAYKLFGSKRIAALTLVLYGLSSAGLSTMLMIRMYMLLTLLTLVMAYLIMCIIQKPDWKLYAALGLTIFAGMMTQYYFVIYAFVLCAAVVLYLLIKKNYRTLVWFSVSAFAGVLALPVFYPAVIDHLFADKLVSAGSAVSNISNIAQYASKLYSFCNSLVRGTAVAVLVGLIVVVMLAVKRRELVSAIKDKRVSLRPMLLIVPAFATLVIVAIISPVDGLRYIYNIIPMFVLTVAYAIYLLSELTELPDRFEWAERFAPYLAVVPLLLSLFIFRPDFIYENQAEYDRLLAGYKDKPCVYMNSGYNSSITQDLMQLMLFENVYISDDADSNEVLEYIGNDDAAIIFIDVNEFWSSGFSSQDVLFDILGSSDYEKYECLYKFGLSEVYLITK